MHRLFHLSRKFCATLLLLVLAGCVTAPKHLAFNRDADVGAKRVVVLTMRHSDIDLFIVNNPALNFGLIGLAIEEANRLPKAHWLKDEVAKNHFDYLTEFRSALTEAMSAKGYELRWSDPVQQPEKAKDVARENYGLRKTYAGIADVDAQLDINFGFIGYAAAGSSSDAPYRPTVVLSARMVSADGKRVLFEDLIEYNVVFPNQSSPISIEPDDHYRYPEFNALQAAGPEAVKGLQVAFNKTAAELARQF
jgi:hypothetical protein